MIKVVTKVLLRHSSKIQSFKLKQVVILSNKYFKVTMSPNNLQNEIEFEFIINAVKEIRNNNKRPDNQTIFDHFTKTAATNMNHSQIDELISSMLKMD